MARRADPITFQTPDGRSFWIRFEAGGKHLLGAAAGWPPRGWICAPEGQSLPVNATRPDVRDAIAHATRVGPDQPWLIHLAERVRRQSASSG